MSVVTADPKTPDAANVQKCMTRNPVRHSERPISALIAQACTQATTEIAQLSGKNAIKLTLAAPRTTSHSTLQMTPGLGQR